MGAILLLVGILLLMVAAASALGDPHVAASGRLRSRSRGYAVVCAVAGVGCALAGLVRLLGV